ncbi:MAG: hypothetical protein ACOCZD_02240 [Haloferacaceae archaeon]
MKNPYWTRVQDVARKAAVDVMNDDADDLPDALGDVDSPAIRADAEFLAELLLQEFIEDRAAIGRAS